MGDCGVTLSGSHNAHCAPVLSSGRRLSFWGLNKGHVKSLTHPDPDTDAGNGCSRGSLKGGMNGCLASLPFTSSCHVSDLEPL